MQKKGNIFAAYSRQARAQQRQIQTERKVSPPYINKQQKTAEPSYQTRKRKAVSPASYDQTEDQINESYIGQEQDNIFTDSDELVELPKPQQRRNNYVKRRTPWTGEETRRLVRLFEEYGPLWNLIKQKDERHRLGAKLTNRSNIDLKDRIRTVKKQYKA
jgi:hypothetical protein